MMNFNALLRGLVGVVLGLGLPLGGQAQTVLPVEVLGPQGTTAQVALPVTDPTKVASLYLRVHRPGFRAASTGAAARASVRVNGSAWVDLTNANCAVFAQEKAYGGIGGGFQTVRLNLAAGKFGTAFVAGANTVSIRLNQTDGHSSGVRVLEINLLDAGGAKLVPESAFVKDNPNTWTAPRPGAADVAEGQRLWREAVLQESPLATTSLKATCSGCHHERGLDLKYFSYSNKSIIERAKFHSLSQVQGEQIASYIRSLTLKKQDGTSYDAPGRPWNPPYQPGPGLDAKPVELWSAGAGLDAVLEKDRDVIPYLFPKGTSTAALKEVASTKATLNMRELPIPLQLPVWDDWLALKHPLDIWGNDFYNTAAWKSYQNARRELVNGRTSVSKERLRDLMQAFTGDAFTHTLFRDGYGNKLPAGVTWEQAALALRSWGAVKLWELHRDFSLDDFAPQIYPAGERGWIGRDRSVFELAPHRSASNIDNFPYQSLLVGKYFSTVWYHTQIIVNPGYRDNVVHIPVDWKYHFSHIENLTNWFTETPGEGLRFTASLIKSMQMWDSQYGVKDPARGWNLKEVWPEWLARPEYNKLFGDVSPDFRKNLAEALFSAWYDKTASHPIADYKRWTLNADGTPNTGGGPYEWAPANIPFPATAPIKAIGGDEYPNRVRDMVVYGRVLGVNGDLLNRIADFGEAMWPLWDFDKLKGGTAAIGNGTGLKGEYFNTKTLDAGGVRPVLTRVDPNLDLNWGEGSPGAGVTANDFSVRWTGFVQAPLTGEYTFDINGDDRVRLFVDNKQLVDSWATNTTGGQGKLTLEGGKLYPIKVEFLEYGGGANVRLRWSLPNLNALVVVPTTQLYPQLPTTTPTPTGPVAAGTYRLLARHSGKALDVSGAAQAEGAAVIQWAPHNELNQQWQLTAVGGGYYKLLAKHSGKALDVSGAGTANGTRVQQWTDNGSSAQRWKIEATTDGYYKLTAECSGKALDVSGISTADGAQVHQWDYLGQANQQWKLEPVAGATAVRAAATAAAPAPTTDETSLSAYPNPSVDGRATLRLKAQAAQTAQVYVYNGRGLFVGLLTVPVPAGGTDFRLPTTWSPDTYFLETRLDGQRCRFALHVE